MWIARTFTFCAAHRLYRYKGKCANMHGHNYKVELRVHGGWVSGERCGMLIDFGELKQLSEWVDQHWDHALLLNVHDPFLLTAERMGWKIYQFCANPTAEQMAADLIEIAADILRDVHQLHEVKVRLWENDHCWAEAGRSLL